MTRQKMYRLVVLLLVIALNGAFLPRLIRKRAAVAEASSKQNRQPQIELVGLTDQHELVGEAKMQRNMPIRCIGSLARDSYWTSVLPLTEEQQKVIMALDHLVNEGRYQTRLADAAAVTAHPTRSEQLLAQSWDRQLEAIRHAIRLVSLGLLTEEQAAFVIQRDVELNGLSALYADKNVTREGYVWIGRRNLEGSSGPEDADKNRADRISRIRSEFVKHAEQVALLGSLSEQQAENLQVVMSEK